MARLTPLTQWQCDTCGQVIKSPKDGYIEWLNDRKDPAMNHDFRIVHHGPVSPLKPPRNCYKYDQYEGRNDVSIDRFLGSEGFARLLGFLDPGEYLEPEYCGPRVNIRDFTELVRRLHVPHYEEARLYWGRASEEGWFEGMHQGNTFGPDLLKRLVEEFSEESEGMH